MMDTRVAKLQICDSHHSSTSTQFDLSSFDFVYSEVMVGELEHIPSTTCADISGLFLIQKYDKVAKNLAANQIITRVAFFLGKTSASYHIAYKLEFSQNIFAS